MFHLVSSQANVQIGEVGSSRDPPPLIPANTLSTPPHVVTPSQVYSPLVQVFTPPNQNHSQPEHLVTEHFVTATQEARATVDSLFWLTFIFGNVSRCHWM